MSDSFSPAPAMGLRGRLRHWRAAIRRTVGGPQSVTVLTLDPQEVARRLDAARSTSA